MKRTICLILAVCTTLLLASCSSEPVEYSEKLSKNRECYIDVTEITPVSSTGDSYFMYAKCTLASGDTVWMESDYQDYVKYIDDEVSVEYYTTYSDEAKYDLAYTARKITYNEPVRLQGKAYTTTDDLGDYNEQRKAKVFMLLSADASVLHQSSEKTSTAVEFTGGERENTVVYTDLKSVSPKSIVEPLRENVVCDCTTSGGDTVKMEISTENYRKYFDSTAVFSGMSSNFKDSVDFSSPVRISGVTVSAKDALGYSATDAEEQMIWFKEIDEDQIAAEKEALNVSYDVTRVEPKYTNDYGSVVVCECTDDSDEKIWMRISAGKYKENFDPDFSYSTYDKLTDSEEASILEYDSPVTINGVSVNPKDILPSYADEDDLSKKAFDFQSKD